MCLWKLNGWIEYLSCRRRASAGLSVKVLAIGSCVAAWSLKLNWERGNQIDCVWIRWQCLCRAREIICVPRWHWCWLCAVYANVSSKGRQGQEQHMIMTSVTEHLCYMLSENKWLFSAFYWFVFTHVLLTMWSFNLHFIHSSGPKLLSTILFLVTL